jgi:hypothetical protein
MSAIAWAASGIVADSMSMSTIAVTMELLRAGGVRGLAHR